MSSINATSTVLVKYISVETRTVKYEYEGKTRTTNSFQELLERAKKAGITVLYTQPVKSYMAEQSKLRRLHDAAQYDEMCAREDAVQLSVERKMETRSEQYVQTNVACDNFDWTLIKGVGPITCQRLWAHGINSLVDAYSATDAELWEATHDKVVFEDVRAYASRMWCS